MSIYDFKVKDAYGNVANLDKYKGKVLLIINSATECGFTPQYEGLQLLYGKLKGEKFEIIDFPCNQFGNQAPGTNAEIATFCNSRFGIQFPIFGKIDVNGNNAEPLFSYLVGQKGFEGFDAKHPLSKVLDDMLAEVNPNYKNDPSIKWNFTKFLIDKNGNVVARFEPTVDIEVIEEQINALL